MSTEVDIQIALDKDDPCRQGLPDQAEIQGWVDQVLTGRDEEAELTIRIVGEAESANLNQEYRHKQGATNVLSFPFDKPPEISLFLLGDLVICAPVVLKEADIQGKPLEAHWAHMVIHGVLHLLGYDHINPEQADEMEALEIAQLACLGYANPYE